MITASALFDRAAKLVVAVYCDERHRARCRRLIADLGAAMVRPAPERPADHELWQGSAFEMFDTAIAWALRDGGGLLPGEGRRAWESIRWVLGPDPRATLRLRLMNDPRGVIGVFEETFADLARIAAPLEVP